ncbi:MAG: hypothetical protein OXC95_15575 [Dehalococcoidia bacterium]|nr:hypothetical protein [Dehalococcoidia bacterium]
MCAIVDANVGHEVFGDAQSDAGRYFFEWLNRANGSRLAIGGKLREELGSNRNFLRWLSVAGRLGRTINVSDDRVEAETESLRADGVCRSNDEHVLALARLSGARLLFTNDNDLQDDFRDRSIVGGVRGRIYTTSERTDVRRTHRDLLNRGDLCDIRG